MKELFEAAKAKGEAVGLIISFEQVQKEQGHRGGAGASSPQQWLLLIAPLRSIGRLRAQHRLIGAGHRRCRREVAAVARPAGADV
jgi:hypothetical protein